MITRPLYASSTCAVTLLTHCCRFMADFSVFADTKFVAASAIPVNTKKTSVNRILKRNIITREPTIIPTAVNSFNIPVCRASDVLSKSLTVRLRIAPVFVRSKKDRGSRFSFSLISVRSRKLSLSAKLAIRSDWRV